MALQTFEAIIERDGTIHLLDKVEIASPCRALVTIMYDAQAVAPETALLSESALGVDWNRPEEDAAWSYLQAAT